LHSHSENIKYLASGLSWQILQPKTEWKALISRIKASLFNPILTPMLRKRWLLNLLTLAAVLQVALTAAGLQGWQCPIRSSLGIVCPGCGLSTAVVALIQGDWQTALHIHIFAPVFLMGFIFLGILSVLPIQVYRKALYWLGALERSTGIIPFLSIGLMSYWCIRILGLT
jgi:hypothetical protein